MADSPVKALVAEFRASVHGELSSRGQIVDQLLDLRSAARDTPLAVAMIDRLLGELPGRTTVANAWWLEAMVDIERTLRTDPVTAARTAASEPAAPVPTGSAPLPRRRPAS